MPSRAEIPQIDTAPGDEISLLDILDNVLTSGVVIHGSIVISLAGVDLVYLGLNAVLTSVETALRYIEGETPNSGSHNREDGGTRQK